MDGHIIRLSVVDSTNIYTTKLLSQSDIPSWTVVVAESQYAGKGQRGKAWDSEYGKNLLCSVVYRPIKFRIQDQFRISVAVSLAVIKTLNHFGINAKVKWPNDILVQGQKIAGILIENQISGEFIENSIIGLGLNLNQRAFKEYQWKATSMFNILDSKELDIEEVMQVYLGNLKAMIEEMYSKKIAQNINYNNLLCYKEKEVDFLFNNKSNLGIVKGVSLFGELIIATPESDMRFLNGEIRQIRTLS